MPAKQSNSVLRVISLLLIWAVVSSVSAPAHEAESNNEEISGNSADLTEKALQPDSGQTPGPGGAENLPGAPEAGLERGKAETDETELINAGKEVPMAKGKKHRLKMRLAGSMCAACLKELRKKLEAFKRAKRSYLK